MQNKRAREQRKNINKGIIKTHIENNFRNYLIVIAIFMVRSYSRCIMCK